MKKRIAILLFTLMFVTLGLPSLSNALPETGSYFDRNLLCKWMGTGDRGGPILDTIADGEPICAGVSPGRPLYGYGTDCTNICEPFAIADKVVERAKETALEIKERIRLIFASPAR
jgi:hypothetical protein